MTIENRKRLRYRESWIGVVVTVFTQSLIASYYAKRSGRGNQLQYLNRSQWTDESGGRSWSCYSRLAPTLVVQDALIEQCMLYIARRLHTNSEQRNLFPTYCSQTNSIRRLDSRRFRLFVACRSNRHGYKRHRSSASTPRSHPKCNQRRCCIPDCPDCHRPNQLATLPRD